MVVSLELFDDKRNDGDGRKLEHDVADKKRVVTSNSICILSRRLHLCFSDRMQQRISPMIFFVC